MNLNLEKEITLSVILALIVTSINSLSTLGNSITKEEAIEVSKKSELVKEGLAIAYSFEVESNYYNSSMVERMKRGHLGEIFRMVPEGHSVWEVIWCVYEGVGGYVIGVIINAESGVIIHETKGVRFG